jgi:hypothetical protein
MGRKKKYFTEEEKKLAQQKWVREYYERNKDKLNTIAKEKYLNCKFIRLNESHIEHIDSMRDVVDKLIEITKTDGSSKIYFE